MKNQITNFSKIIGLHFDDLECFIQKFKYEILFILNMRTKIKINIGKNKKIFF